MYHNTLPLHPFTRCGSRIVWNQYSHWNEILFDKNSPLFVLHDSPDSRLHLLQAEVPRCLLVCFPRYLHCFLEHCLAPYQVHGLVPSLYLLPVLVPRFACPCALTRPLVHCPLVHCPLHLVFSSSLPWTTSFSCKDKLESYKHQRYKKHSMTTMLPLIYISY